MEQTQWLATLNSSRGSQRQTTVEYVKDALRRAILGGELLGGTRLVQADLAAALDTSTTPVREALRDLAGEGLVRFDAHRGAVVYEPDAEELDEIYRICRVLEPLAIREAVENINDELIAHLRRLHTQMLDEPNPVEWIDINRTFHMSIYKAASRPRLTAIIQNLRDASVMYIGATLTKEPALLARANSEHGDILDALERRDAEAAIDATLRHLTLSIKVISQQNGDRSKPAD